MLQFSDQRQHLGEIRLGRMFAEILLCRGQDRVLAIQDGLEQFCELRAPFSRGRASELQRRRLVGLKNCLGIHPRLPYDLAQNLTVASTPHMRGSEIDANAVPNVVVVMLLMPFTYWSSSRLVT